MSKPRWISICIVTLSSFALLQPVCAQSAVGLRDVAVRSHQITASIDLPGIHGELTLLFEDVEGLTADTLKLSARLIDPADPQWRERLPRDVFIADKFPVVLQIEPDRSSDLKYHGRWSLEMRTSNLEFSPYTPLRLFRAPTGGAFADITETMGFGSYRVRGIGADFSEFVIAADLRMIENVIAKKFGLLAGLLLESQQVVSARVQVELVDRVAGIQQAFEDGNLQSAFEQLDSLVQFIAKNSGGAIPNLSVPRDRLVGLAPRLRAAATSLRFSLDLVALPTAVGGGTGLATVLSLPDGTDVELQLTFAESFDVDLSRLRIKAERVDVDDPALLARLPRGVRVPREFPMLIHLHPDPSIAQAFSGNWSLDLHTEALEFHAETPLRLFKAPDGGAFRDITETIGLGSYRVRGTGADFSEFLVVEDLRSPQTIVRQKLKSLYNIVGAHGSEIEDSLLMEVESRLQEIAAAVDTGAYQQAVDTTDALLEMIRKNRGDAIPTIWRSNGDRVNVAGLLKTSAQTLRFSLELLASPTSGDPADVNRNGKVDAGDVFQLIERVFGSP